ncbi:MAG: winged helix-turn-helix transcriptional regulator [Prevotella sp.]|nr:winged helix-turn-helix transcriptional regulator [Prevotella sp.]
MNNDETCKEIILPNKQIPIGDNQQEIINFIVNNGKSDLKSISKATGLKVSRTRDYLKMLVDKGLIDVEGNYKNKLYKLKTPPKI